MDVRIVDRWRKVTIAPPEQPGPSSDAKAVLDGLIAAQPPSSVDQGQCHFEADAEFLALLGEDGLEAKDATHPDPRYVGVWRGVQVMGPHP